MTPIKFWLTVLTLSSGCLTTSVSAQITPTLDPTGTIVSPNGNQIDISGGKRSGDGTSLFHSFQQFNLSAEQTATFRSSPAIQNIFGRVVGGDASVINGLIRVTGSTANLYLMNPAGILFGPNARLDVPGAFTATTATGIGFGNGWFNAFGSNDYSALVGNPQSFAFTLSQAGAIANLGNLTVNPGQSLTLLGGTVLNAGTLSAPGGKITIASVAGGNLVRISQDGALMNLELKAAPVEPGVLPPMTPVSLPALLTGGNLSNANTVTVAPDGTVRLARSPTPIASNSGATTVAGNLNVAGNIGGTIHVLGNAIALQNANLDANGTIAGGTIRIGGAFHGLGTLPTATQTWIDQTSRLNANALSNGKGGQVVVWANQATRFDGTIQARGGVNGGNGGTVEVSGKDTLIFRGNVDTSAPHGTAGTLLLDPQNIVVVNGTGAADDAQLSDGQILATDGGASTFTISEQKLESLAGTTNVTLEAINNITINDIADNALTFQAGAGSVVFTAGGAFSMNAGDTIRAEQRSLTITAASINAGAIDTSTSANGPDAGAINLTATTGAISTGALNAGTQIPSASGAGTGGNVTLNAATGITVVGGINAASNLPNMGAKNAGNGGNVSLSAANGDITVSGDIQTFSLVGKDSPANGGSITLSAPNGGVTAGNLDSRSAAGSKDSGNAGAIAVTAGTNIALSNLSANSATSSNVGNTGNGASVTLSAPNSVSVGRIDTASTSVSAFSTQQRLDQPIAITSNEINLTGGANSVLGGSVTLRSNTLTQDINVGGATDAGVASLDLTTTDLTALSNGFTNLTLGQPGGTGTIILFNSVTNTGSTPFNAPVILAGGGTLVGPNQAATWNITGPNRGNLNGLFASGLTFSNISNLTGGNANNNFIFASNAATISGAILGGTGTDTLNYSARTANQTLNLAVTKAASVETILGGTGTNSLIGDNLANTWTVTGSNSGTVNSTNFTNFQNLIGGSGSDTFAIPDGGSVTGTINGGAGTNTLNYSAYNSAIAINLGTNAASATGGISNIGVIQGGPNPNNTLTGTAGNNTFNLTGTNAGNVGGVSFSGFSTLQGQAGNDTFTFNGGTIATINGGGGSNAIVGANTTSTWNLTGASSGNLNGATFNNIQSLTGGTGNDTFAVGNGVTFGGTIDGGGGTNTLNYSAFTSPLTVNLAALGANNIASIIGTMNAPSTLIGANIVNTWSLTGANAGTVNGTVFSQFQNLGGGGGTDTFTIANGGSVAGTISGGSGTNTLDYSTYISPVAVNLGTNTATGTGGISNIEVIQGSSNVGNTLTGTAGNNTFNLTGTNAGSVGGVSFSDFSTVKGQAGNDTFTFNGGTIATIDGGGGSNTIVAANTANTWMITGINAGQVNSSAFSNIQNLTGGNQNQTVTFSGAIAQLGGNVTAGAGDLTLEGDKINIQGTIAGSGNLLIQPLGTGQAIQLGGTGSSDPGVLALTGTELNSLQNGFNAITIGRSNDSGAITLAGNIAFADPVTLRSPNGSINTNGFNLTGTDNAAFTLLAGQSITTANVSTQGGAIALIGNTINTGTLTTQNSAGAGGNLTLQGTGGAIATGAINTSGTTNSGNVSLTATSQITTGTIDTSSTTGNGGKVALQSTGAIQTSSINAQAGVSGGNVDITTPNFFRATSTFTATDGRLASIATIGGSGNGSVIIRHGGNGLTPFEVGSGTINGTAGAITNGNFSIAPFQSFPGIYTLGNLAILTRERTAESSPKPPTLPAVPAESSPKPPTLSAVPVLDYRQNNPKMTLEEDSVLDTERRMTRKVQDYLTLPKEETKAPLTTIAQTRTTLRQVEATKGIKPALLYVFFSPSQLSNKTTQPQLQSPDKTKALIDVNSLNAKKGALKPSGEVQVAQLLDSGDRPDKERDTLELVLMTADEQPIHRHLWNVTRAQVLQVVHQLQQQVTDATTSPDDYLPPAQQLYNWIVNPVRADLEQHGIQNLIFILDDGLRSMPVVALHNGHHFLVEDYSVSLMPSFSLTQLSDGNIHDMKVLAMGASEFKEQSQLPAVPLELATIAKKVWTGESFLNNEFTIQNLKAQRSRHPFKIVHLATHGKFLPGKASNSYIQFSDQKLQLDQVRQLGLQTPPVELLVFSACTTALGDEKAELGFAGMAVQAGVISSLASLWAVSDDATLGLMTDFYHQLRSSRTKVEALRQAQLAMINGKIRVEKGRLMTAEGESLLLPPELAGGSWDFTHPKYWSAFTLIGSPW